MAKRKRTEAQIFAELRRKAKIEQGRLRAEYKKMGHRVRASARGRAIQQEIADISTTMEQTKFGYRPTEERKASARLAAEELYRRIGGGTRELRNEAKAQQQRQNRIFRNQLRVEARGGESAMFGGEAAKDYREKIFYMSTQSIWRGHSNEDRDKVIMEALGTDSLEEAYRMVLAQNKDALQEARENGDDPYEAFKAFVTAYRAERR